ncbi:MAG TPA: peptide chain release factor aRF-1 [Alphaproteobacteria bacterium]|nr:peptide chain release factor aRF-1 [Alphaproteobacteria bacterium]
MASNINPNEGKGKITPQQRQKLKHFVKEIEGFKGRHTELVTVYVPQGYDLVAVINHLQQEQGTASNIKSKGTRENVIAALEKMIQHLKLVGRTPPNGLASFAGNVAERDGQQDYKVWSIEPPTPINIRIYRCDKEFILEPLKEMASDRTTYGLVVMDKRDAIIAILKGKTIIPLVKEDSMVPGKMRAGGQSSVRFAQNRELAAKAFYKKIGDMMKDQFLNMGDELKGIIVGGPGPTKYEFADGQFITNEVKKKIIGIKDLSYTEEFGLQELVEKSEDLLAQEEIGEEKKIMQRFFDTLGKHPGKASYGKDEVMQNIKYGAVDQLLLSESLSDQDIDLFTQEAEAMGSTVNLISTETREGVQLKELGKIAAILRYEVHKE